MKNKTDELTDRLATLMFHIACAVIDGLFLIAWAGLTLLMNFCIEKWFDFHGPDRTELLIFKWSFEIGTLIFVLLYVAEDIITAGSLAIFRIKKRLSAKAQR